MNRDVLVVIGAGGLGLAIARRQGPGKSILLADFSESALQAGAKALEHAGHTVATQIVDVSSRESVNSLAQRADRMGSVMQLAQAAGVSPTQAPPAVVLAVDLVGTALVLEAFGRVIVPGGAGVHISSMAGHRGNPLDPAHAEALAHTPADELLMLPFLDATSVPTSTIAYEISKRGMPCASSLPASFGATGVPASTRSAPASSRRRWPAMRWPDRAHRFFKT